MTVSDTAWPGDPYHEGASQPLAHLQGGMQGPPTQMPMTSEAMTNPRSAAAENIQQSWNSTSLGATPPPTPNNDKNEAH
jgi:hypothetical protein